VDDGNPTIILTAVERVTGVPAPHVPPLALRSARLLGLTGIGSFPLGVAIEPHEVLISIECREPTDWPSRVGLSALLKLALVAEVYGLVLVCAAGAAAPDDSGSRSDTGAAPTPGADRGRRRARER
jgi:hypothetical protein